MNYFTQKNKLKKIFALFLAVLMSFSSLFAVPIFTQAATTSITNYWNSGGWSHKYVRVNGKDAFCINYGEQASGTFKTNTKATSYYNNLSSTQKKAINQILTYSKDKGYLNYSGTGDKYVYYSAIQRAIWQITNKSASNNGLSSWYKKQTQKVYDDIMKNYSIALTKSDAPSLGSVKLTEANNYTQSKTNSKLTYAWTLSTRNDKYVSASFSATDHKLTVKSKTVDGKQYFSGTRKITLNTKKTVFDITSSQIGALGSQYAIMTAGNDKVLSSTLSVTSTAPTTSTPIVLVPHKAAITVHKYDAETGKGLPGAEFELTFTNQDGVKETQQKTTDASGNCTFKQLDVFQNDAENNNKPTTKIKYTIKEVGSPEDYIFTNTNNVVSNITLTENQTYQAKLDSKGWPNYRQLGDAKIIKQVEGENDYILGKDFEFVLTNKETGKTYTTKTDVKGEAYFCNVPVGEYTIKEIMQSAYIPTSEKTFFIDWDKNTSTANRTYCNDPAQYTESTTLKYDDGLSVLPNIESEIGVFIEDNNDAEHSYDENTLCALRIELKDDTGNPIKDASFNVTDLNYTSYGSFITDEDGIAMVLDLPAGNYVVSQESTSGDYIIDTEPKLVSLHDTINDAILTFVNDKGNVTDDSDTNESANRVPSNVFNFVNTFKRGDLEIIKSCEIFGSNPLKDNDGRSPGRGFKFQVTSNDNVTGQILTYTVVSGEDGRAVLYDIPVGTYTIKEIDVPKEYKAPAGKTVQVKWDGQTKYDITGFNNFSTKADALQAATLVTVNIENVFSRFVIEGFKSDNENKAVQGAVYGIFNIAETNYTKERAYATSTSDENGGFKFTNVPIGKYQVVELVAPEGYLLDQTPHIVDVDGEQETYILNCVDKIVKGQINIIKTGTGFVSASVDDKGVYTPIYGPVGLKGVCFDILAAEDIIHPNGTTLYRKGDVVEQIWTDDAGVATSSKLPLGKYTIVETTTLPGYYLDQTPIEVDLAFEGYDVPIVLKQLNIHNEKQKVNISLQKMLEALTDFNIGVGEEALDVVYGLFTAEEMTAIDGSIIPANSLICVANDENFIVGEDNTICNIKFNTDIPFGYDYYVKEIQTNEKYVLNTEVYNISYKEAPSFEKEYNYYINAAQADENGMELVIMNNIVRGTIIITKTDVATGKVIPNCKIEILDANKKVIFHGVTDENGEVMFEALPYGTYYYREYEAPEGYILDSTPYEFSITEDGQIIKAKMTNEAIPDPAKPHKVNTGFDYELGVLLLGVSLLAAGTILSRRKREG